MPKYCNQTAIPTTDNSSSCDSYMGFECVLSTNTHSSLEIGPGDNLDLVITRLINKIGQLQNKLVDLTNQVATLKINQPVPPVVNDGDSTPV